MRKLKIVLSGIAALAGIGGAVAKAVFAPSYYVKNPQGTLYIKLQFQPYNPSYCYPGTSPCVYLINSDFPQLPITGTKVTPVGANQSYYGL